ncbi:facilitated trehalose transporter Tret1-like [Episyrphus balteatus]|uniref:facilitated trehalose transporter Tret1-like n=1 Tax=Episyrphus balteatus TaxID=286459 RepID=UPI0024867AD9|nr:facilitated trehalose transporter Tret1-like [Episyrphus balteatus]
MDQIKTYRMFIACGLANLGYLILGICIAWTSPMTPRLREHTDDSPLTDKISDSQDGWISSLLSVGAIIGCPIAGPLYDRIGRKWTLLSSSFLFAASFVLLILGNNIWFIYVARVLQGIGCGLVNTTSPIYNAETATDNLRGAIGSLMTILMIGGILFVYCIGPYVRYVTLQWFCLATPIIFFVTFIFMPESPYYYALKNQSQKGIKSLQFLRGQSPKTAEEEMSRIQKAVDEDMSNKGNISEILKNRAYKKAFVICIGLLTFQQFSGTTAVTFNSQSIFTSAQSNLDPAIATIIMGLVQLVANLITPFVVDRAGRKIILMIAALGMCLSLAALGTFFYIQKFGDASNILWIPIPALSIFYAMYAFGFGPIPSIIMGEILPSNIKSTVSSSATTFHWVAQFMVTRWYPELNALGSYIAFWMFGGFCAAAFFFVHFVVVETKGLSLQRIQEKLYAA